jgi:hypothetical protein
MRSLQIGHHGVEVAGSDQRERLLARTGDARLESGVLQRSLDHRAHIGVVVDDQDPAFHVAKLYARRITLRHPFLPHSPSTEVGAAPARDGWLRPCTVRGA